MPKGDGRRGNGGWGGPAKGKGRGDGIPKPWTKDTPTLTTKPGHHPEPTPAKLSRMERAARDQEQAEQMRANLVNSALTGKTEKARVAASVAVLNRLEGMPLARNVNLNVNDASSLTDDEIAAEIDALTSRARSAAGIDAGDNSAELPNKSVGMVH